MTEPESKNGAHIGLRILSAMVVSFVVMVFVLAQYTGSGQTLTVQARTLGTEISFSPKRQTWRFLGATLCRHRPPTVELTQEEQQKSFRVCSSDNALPDVSVPDGLMSIGQGARIRIDARDAGGIRLRMLSSDSPVSLPGDHPWRPRDELVLSAAQWRDVGTLRFDGEIIIGHRIEDGTRNYLLEGRYVIRERLLLHHVLEIWQNPEPVAVAQDDLFLGDSLRIASNNEDAEDEKEKGVARGFLTAVANPQDPGFEVVAASTPDQSAVTIRRFQNRPFKIEARWSDRIQNDPILIALSIIAALAGWFTVRVGWRSRN